MKPERWQQIEDLYHAVVETEPNAPLTVVVNWAAGAPK